MKIQVFPAPEQDHNTQKCRLNLPLIDQLKAQFGDVVLIKRVEQNDFLLCKVWPSRCITSGIEASHFVTCTECVAETVFRPCFKHQEDRQITLVGKAKPISKVAVTVVLHNLKHLEKYSAGNCQDLCSIFNCFLHNVFVCEGCKIDLRHAGKKILNDLSFLLVSKIEQDTGCCYGLVRNSTQIYVEDVVSREKYEQMQKLDRANQRFGGLDNHIQQIGEYVKLSSMFKSGNTNRIHLPRGLLLTGPSGCGKTCIIRQVARECHAYLHVICGSELNSSRPGETEENLHDAFKKASLMTSEGPSMLVLEELDVLCPAQGSDKVSADSRVRSTLLRLVDDNCGMDGLSIIGITNNLAKVDPAIRRSGRLEKEFSVGYPSQTARKAIFQVLCESINLGEDVDFDELAETTPGYTGADLCSLVQHAQYEAAQKIERPMDNTHPQKITREDFQRARHMITASGTKSSSVKVDSKPVFWRDIGGLNDVKMKLKQAVEMPLKYPEVFRRLGLTAPKGVLLCGPPGCAKSTLVKALASSSRINLLAVSGAELFSPYVGDSEQRLMQIFHEARTNVPCILLIDELDSVIGSRSKQDAGPGVQERVLSTLLNEMDGIGNKLDEVVQDRSSTMENGVSQNINPDVLVISATNRPDIIDDALLRPGRFDKIIHVPPPDKQARKHILEIYTRKVPLEGVDIAELADLTEGYTGADLENLCREAVLSALSEEGFHDVQITTKHFTQVLNVIKPSLEPH